MRSPDGSPVRLQIAKRPQPAGCGLCCGPRGAWFHGSRMSNPFCFHLKHSAIRLNFRVRNAIFHSFRTFWAMPHRECLFVAKKIPIFAVLGLHSQADISESVFAFVLSRECGNFKTEGRRTALISCLDVGRDAFCIPISHIYSSVGYCVVYFSQGHTTTSYLINEISSTLSFCAYPAA